MIDNQMLLAAIGALSAAVVRMFWMIVKNHRETKEALKKTQDKLDECESDRTMLWQIIADTKGETIEALKASLNKG